MQYLRAYRDIGAGDELTFVASTPGVKSDGLAIDQNRWDLSRFHRNPVFLWVHDYSSLPIGIGDAWVEGGMLRFKPTKWAHTAIASDIHQAYDDGILNAVSVGWEDVDEEGRPIKRGQTAARHVLLDVSAVPVPGDPDALVERQRAAWGALGRELLQLSQTDTAAGLEAVVERGERPYPNEHACRLREPSDFEPDSFRREDREHEGKPYAVIMGKLDGEDSMTEQAYRYPIDEWSEDDARAHCRSHNGETFEPADPEVTAMEDEERSETAEAENPEVVDTSESRGDDPWADVAAGMVAVFDPESDEPDDERERMYRALLPKYRRHGCEPPEFMTAAEVKALSERELAGLFLSGELDAASWVGSRVAKVLAARNWQRIEKAHGLLGEVLADANGKDAKEDKDRAAEVETPEPEPEDIIDPLADLRAMRALLTEADHE